MLESQWHKEELNGHYAPDRRTYWSRPQFPNMNQKQNWASYIITANTRAGKGMVTLQQMNMGLTLLYPSTSSRHKSGLYRDKLHLLGCTFLKHKYNRMLPGIYQFYIKVK